MDSYHLTTIIDVAQTIGNTLIEKAKDVIDLLAEEQEEKAEPKDE